MTSDVKYEYSRKFGVSLPDEIFKSVDRQELMCCGGCGLQFFCPIRAGTPSFYNSLDSSLLYYPQERWEFIKARELIDPNHKVLDYGCGSGHFLSMLPNLKKEGLEFSPASIEKAKKSGLTIHSFSERLFEHRTYDVITMLQVLEHIPDPRGILEQAVPAISHGGLLIVSVPNNDYFMGKAIFEPLNLPPHHPLRWTAKSLRYIPNLFPLRLMCLSLEPLNAEHLFVYRKTLFTNLISNLFRRPLPLLKQSLPMISIRKCANLFARLSLKFAPKPKFVPGHTILAVYQKTADA